MTRSSTACCGPSTTTAPPAAGPVPGDVVTSPTITLPAYSHGFVRFSNGGGSGLKAC